MPDVELTIVEGREFGAEVVPADGLEFSRCRFAGTILVFHGEGNFTLPGCSGDFEIQLDGSAITVMNQLMLLYHCGYSGFVERMFETVRNPTGAGVQ
jgi:hypothetical protein